MAVWKEYKIGDLCDTISETYRGHDEEVILINTSDVLEGRILNHQKVPNRNVKGQFKKTFKTQDILYSEIRPENNRFAYVDMKDTSLYIASTKLMVIRANIEIIEPRFLYAILTAKSMTQELQVRAELRSGTFPQITFKTELATIKVCVPDRNTQKKIVSFLDAINRKIEVNNKINRNLSAQVAAIYKAWFVDFKTNNGICPDDWKDGILGDIAEISSGKRPPMKQNDKTDDVCIPLVGAASIMGYTNAILYDSKILVIGRVGTHGVVQRFDQNCWPSDNTLVITTDRYEFVNQILLGVDYESINRGSTQPLITQGDLKKIEIIVPNDAVLDEFENLAGGLMSQYEKNVKENAKLSELRDSLLPKLMSGELDVSEMDL